jgi:hypothetical protein
MKWRTDRGGPTSSEVMKVAEEIGVSLDSERLQKKTEQIQDTWAKEKKKLGKVMKGRYGALLPRDFQRPELFRQRMEQKSGPIPQLNVPALPVYLVLISAIAYWCYYGYQYNKIHLPVSFTALVIFLSMFFVLFITLMWFRGYHRFVRICPVLKRIADLRPGAFLFITGTSPALFYAREQWTGKVTFQEGGEDSNSFTRVDVVTRHSVGLILISRKSFLNKVIGLGDEDVIQLPESDFSQKFSVSGTDAEFAKRLLSSTIMNAIIQLEEFKHPSVEIDRNTVAVQIDGDLSNPRKEAALSKFLEQAETIIDTLAYQIDVMSTRYNVPNYP